MAEQNYEVIDFNQLSATNDGKTLLYADNKICQSVSSLGEIVNDKIGYKIPDISAAVEGDVLTYKDSEIKWVEPQSSSNVIEVSYTSDFESEFTDVELTIPFPDMPEHSLTFVAKLNNKGNEKLFSIYLLKIDGKIDPAEVVGNPVINHKCKGNSKLDCYFTEEGKAQFGDISFISDIDCTIGQSLLNLTDILADKTYVNSCLSHTQVGLYGYTLFCDVSIAVLASDRKLYLNSFTLKLIKNN